MGRIAQSVGMTFVRGCLVRGLVAIYVFGVFIECFLLPLRRMSRTTGADGTEIFLPFGIGAFLLMVLPALVAYVAARTRNGRFDAMFGSLGLAGFPYAVQYRRYDGTYCGRRLQAFFSRGPRVALEADTAVAARLGITAGSGDTGLLAGLTGAKQIRFAVPAFDGLDVFGEEETWVRRFLSEPGVPALLGRLLRFDGPFARRQLVLRPGALNVTFQLSTAFMSWIPSPAQVRDWADALVALAQIAERVPPPEVPIAPTRLEQQVDSVRRMGFAVNPGALALGTMLATSLVIAAIAGIIVVAQKSCRPTRGPGSHQEGAQIVSNVVQVVRSLQVAELKPLDVLGGLGILDREDADALHAKAGQPHDARIVIRKNPSNGAGREVEWVFPTPPAIRLAYIEEQLGKLEYSADPDDPKSVIGVATTTPIDGAKWPVRVRVTFVGEAGGPITRIAVFREPSRGSSPTTPSANAAAVAAFSSTTPSEPATAAGAPASPGAALPSPCPTSFADAGPMEIGESRSCVCPHLGASGTVRGSGRYAPDSWICDAARHAGVLRKPGDVVTFTRQPDCPRLWGSRANEKVSLNLGVPTPTFSFASEPPPCPPPPRAAADLRPCPASGKNGLDSMPEGTSFDCTCTYNGIFNGRLQKGTRGVAWGTNVYATFSSVCDAAQHAGAVDFGGSTVTVFLGGTCDRLFGTKRFGIGSDGWSKPARVLSFQSPFPACPTGPW
ncbi:MAG: LCCL domain-containing protein [Thermoanaerobaculia bacterium]